MLPENRGLGEWETSAGEHVGWGRRPSGGQHLRRPAARWRAAAGKRPPGVLIPSGVGAAAGRQQRQRWQRQREPLRSQSRPRRRGRRPARGLADPVEPPVVLGGRRGGRGTLRGGRLGGVSHLGDARNDGQRRGAAAAQGVERGHVGDNGGSEGFDGDEHGAGRVVGGVGVGHGQADGRGRGDEEADREEGDEVRAPVGARAMSEGGRRRGGGLFGVPGRRPTDRRNGGHGQQHEHEVGGDAQGGEDGQLDEGPAADGGRRQPEQRERGALGQRHDLHDGEEGGQRGPAGRLGVARPGQARQQATVEEDDDGFLQPDAAAAVSADHDGPRRQDYDGAHYVQWTTVAASASLLPVSRCDSSAAVKAPASTTAALVPPTSAQYVRPARATAQSAAATVRPSLASQRWRRSRRSTSRSAISTTAAHVSTHVTATAGVESGGAAGSMAARATWTMRGGARKGGARAARRATIDEDERRAARTPQLLCWRPCG